MPGFDQTGPQGNGPGTGRGFGPCQGHRANQPLGFGRGRGYRHLARASDLPRRSRFGYGPNPYTKPIDSDMSLLEQERYLEEQLQAVRDRRKQTDQD